MFMSMKWKSTTTFLSIVSALHGVASFVSIFFLIVSYLERALG